MSGGDTTILVSPAEPARIKELLGENGQVSVLPERYGVDFLWRTRGVWYGAQRKTVTDLLASLDDGRITREIAQMTSHVSMPTLVIEGKVHFTNEGRLTAHSWAKDRWTLRQWRGFLWSLQSRGIAIAYSATISDTVDFVVDMAEWSSKATHTSVTARPKLVESPWGVATNRDWAVFLLQGFDGIGAGVAGDIFDHFGRVPLQWEVDRDGLLAVKGLGPKRVDKMIGALS